jgi:AraC-like DNA-binding protein
MDDRQHRCTILPVQANRGSPSAAVGRAEKLAELRTLIARHARPDVTTAIDGVLLSAADKVEEPHPSSSGTVMALIVQGSKRLALGDRTYDYGPGQYLVASIDLPVTGHYTEASPSAPALGFGLVLRPATIASLLLDAQAGSTVAPSRATKAAPPALGVADASSELLDAVIRMLRLLDRPEDQPVLAPMIEREILWRLLLGPMGPTMRQIGLSDSSLTQISRAVRWIHDHYAEPFRVEGLARSCAMSTSAFHRNFHAVTALSPIQFQKRVRLQQARLLLLAGLDEVATVGYTVGYDSASQFNREYRRHFGLPPGRDAARLRASAVVSA